MKKSESFERFELLHENVARHTEHGRDWLVCGSCGASAAIVECYSRRGDGSKYEDLEPIDDGDETCADNAREAERRRVDDALSACRDHWGRRWKHELRQVWANGRYPSNLDSGILQSIRNSYGPSWLVGYKLPS